MNEYIYRPLGENVEEMFIGPFGSSLKNECFVDKEEAYCMVYEQKHAIQKTMDVETRYINEQKYNELKRFNVRSGDIIVSCRGTIGETYIIPDGAPLGIMHPSIMKIRLKEGVYDKYYFNLLLRSRLKKHESEANGSGVKMAVSATELSKELLPVPTMNEQLKITDIVSKINNVIGKRKQELAELDDLIKTRFVEMFGDPVTNPHGFEKVTLSDLAEIKIGPFGSLLHKEDYIEGGHALVNPSHIIDGKVSVDEKLTVSDDKFAELSAYHLQIGDVVMGRRGEMGRCAVVLDDGLLCGTGSLLIRTKGEVTADYIQKIISFPSFKKTIEDMAVGQTMPNLNVPIVSGFQIIKPPMEVQSAYYKFVEQLDKSKVAIQKALDEMQILFDSLLQKYFS